MKEFVIFTDSCCDLENEYLEKEGIVTLPMSFSFKNGEESYVDDPSHKEMSIKTFYDRLRNKEVAKTNQVNMLTFEEKAEEVLKEGKSILVLSFSSALSGTYNTLSISSEELKEKYPELDIKVVDSLCASMGEGLFVYFVNEFKQNGDSLEECYEKAMDLRHHILHYFTVDDLGCLQRGGRLTASKAFIANLLNLKPVLHVDPEGKLVPIGKTMGRKKSLMEILSKFEAECIDDRVVFISHGDCEDDANFVKERILAKHPNIKVLMTNYIGPVIGAHSGPGTLAVYFKGEKR